MDFSSSITNVCVPAKSENDNREYRSFTIKNNDLQVLVISDPETDRSAAAMACGVGFLADYTEVEGLAHFCEHMLFLGTKKYPNEDSYSQAISMHGGSCNAWTDCEQTVYHFDVSNGSLFEILDRFAQFFIAPLFTKSATNREMNAVHSEHQRNMYSDVWRGFDVLRHVINPQHPLSKFHSGNLTTLRDRPLAAGVNIHELLLQFYKQYYSANRFKLVILGCESLDELTNCAINLFSPIPNYNIPQPVYDSNFLQKPGAFVELYPVRQARELTITWWLPSTQPYILTSPLGLMSHCIGDEGPGSLLSLLKANKFATELVSGCFKSLSFASQFKVSITLTATGIANIPTILRLVHAYIAMICHSSDKELYRMAKENQESSEIQFRFAEKTASSTAVSTYAVQMFEYPPEKVVQGANIQHEINLDDIRKFANLLTLDNSTIVLNASEIKQDIPFCNSVKSIETQLESLSIKSDILDDEEASLDDVNAQYNNKIWLGDDYYKTRYTSNSLSPEIRNYIQSGLLPDDLTQAIKAEPASYGKLSNPKDLLRLPVTNPFIPTEFDILTSSTQQHSSKLPIIDDEIEQWPTVINNDKIDNKFTNSITDLTCLSSSRIVNPTNQQPLNIDQLKNVIKDLVDKNLVGLNSQSKVLLSKEEENCGTKLDNIFSDSFISQLFPQDSLLPPPIVKKSKTKKEKLNTDEKSDDLQENNNESESDDDATDGPDAEESDEESSKNNQLFDLETFFTEKLEIVKQFIPPVQLPVPLPSSSKFFTITQSSYKNVVPGVYANLGYGLEAITAPLSLWYKFTTQYNTPNVSINLSLELENVPQTFTILYVAALSDAVGEQLYPATICGISYNIYATLSGLQISVTGHREGASKVLLVILQAFHNVDYSFMQRQIDTQIRAYASSPTQSSIQQANNNFRSLTYKKVLHVSQKIAQFNQILPRLEDFIGITRKQLRSVTILIVGNVSQDYSIRLGQSIAQVLQPTESFYHHNSVGNIAYPIGQNIVSAWENGNPLDKQCGIMNQYRVDDGPLFSIPRSQQIIANHKKNPYPIPTEESLINGTAFNNMTYHTKYIYTVLIKHIISNLAFDSLRTKQQLGYIVWTELSCKQAGYGISFSVQSSYPPQYVDQRIEYFLRSEVPKYLTTQSINSFSDWKSNLIGLQSGLLAQWIHLTSESNTWWSHISSSSYDFYISLLLSFLIPHLDRHTLLAYYSHYYCNVLNRNKLAVHIHPSGSLKDENTEQLVNEYNEYLPHTVITSPTEALTFKSLYPGCDY